MPGGWQMKMLAALGRCWYQLGVCALWLEAEWSQIRSENGMYYLFVDDRLIADKRQLRLSSALSVTICS